jgi:hypothetical protein
MKNRLISYKFVNNTRLTKDLRSLKSKYLHRWSRNFIRLYKSKCYDRVHKSSPFPPCLRHWNPLNFHIILLYYPKFAWLISWSELYLRYSNQNLMYILLISLCLLHAHIILINTTSLRAKSAQKLNITDHFFFYLLLALCIHKGKM